MAIQDLEGFRVGVTADRRGEDQAILLARLGLEPVRGPVLRTEPAPAGGRLRAVTEELIASPPDYLVANTGFGIRAWWEHAAGWGLDVALSAGLADRRLAARGPKAAGALRSLGLPVWWRSPTEQLDSVADRLLEEDVRGARVALQLHGDDRQTVTARLQAAGATVVEVPVYRWALPVDNGPALELIREACAGGLDALTFTAGPAVRQLLELADADGRAGALLEACNSHLDVVCVGPVCAAVAVEEGIDAPAIPDNWRLGAMVTRLGELLATRRVERRLGSVVLVVQGRLVRVGEARIELAPAGRRALALLSRSGGRPVPASVVGSEGMAELGALRAGLGAAAPLLEVGGRAAALLPGDGDITGERFLTA